MPRKFPDRLSSPKRSIRPKCKHGSCTDHVKEGADYCEFHAPYHMPKTPSVYESSIRQIPDAWLMAGRARVRRRIQRLPGVEAAE